jgi:hypothetical protein
MDKKFRSSTLLMPPIFTISISTRMEEETNKSQRKNIILKMLVKQE